MMSAHVVELDVVRRKAEAERLNERRAGVQPAHPVVMPMETRVNVGYAQTHESRTLGSYANSSVFMCKRGISDKVSLMNSAISSANQLTLTLMFAVCVVNGNVNRVF